MNSLGGPGKDSPVRFSVMLATALSVLYKHGRRFVVIVLSSVGWKGYRLRSLSLQMILNCTLHPELCLSLLYEALLWKQVTLGLLLVFP